MTGAASGIGRATCLALAEQGFAVAAADLPGCEAEVGLPLVADVAEEAQVERLVEVAERELGPLEALVTAAGFIEAKPLEEIGEAQWERMLAVHLDGTYHCCRAVAPGMAERGRGAIVTVASELALTGAERHAHYCAAKGALIGFAKSIALELAPYGVRVNCVAPGPTDTPLLTDEWRTPEYLGSLPLGRLARPEEIAAAIGFLISEDGGSYYVGQVVSPNCGAVI